MFTALNLHRPARAGKLEVAQPKIEDINAREILRGLLQGEFQAYVQPKFDLTSNTVHSMEVLARWQHPELGLLCPAVFIPTMEREHLLDDLVCELLEQGLAGQIKQHNDGRKLGVAFNLSLLQLTRTALVERLLVRLLKHSLPLSSVTFEITEDGPAIASDICVQNVIRLRQLGVRLSLDDYGTGHSTLFRLCQLPFDEIKLAGEFTRHVLKSSQHRSIARSTTLLARELGMGLIVEGIETEEQRCCLAQMGVRIGQGYLCAPPMPVDALGEWFTLRENGFAA
ncbi:EAL domain-containing protein [Pseudomonas glycinae]|uniref:EAL domain-containing protein n=1 Tax=Pseudomonas glycinae TaxID=1785145 RepID=UPI001C8ADCB9|nr:EAL domain-containing protein [Pseudomonas glycinae]MBX8622171.1 EAL domain-containing protein [Pseudomonas glycinae]